MQNVCLLKLHILSYWFLIPIVCSWPCRDLQPRALHDFMHWVQSDGIFPRLMFYLRVVYVFMTVPVTKLLSNLYYGFGWSTGHRLQPSAELCRAFISQFPIMLQMLHRVPGPGNDMQSAEARPGRHERTIATSSGRAIPCLIPSSRGRETNGT